MGRRYGKASALVLQVSSTQACGIKLASSSVRLLQYLQCTDELEAHISLGRYGGSLVCSPGSRYDSLGSTRAAAKNARRPQKKNACWLSIASAAARVHFFLRPACCRASHNETPPTMTHFFFFVLPVYMVRTSKTDHFFKLAPFWSPLPDLIDFGMAGKLLTSATR